MATPTTWWLLPVLLVTFPYCCCSSPGPPAPPSNLECCRPCNKTHCSVIECIWDPKPHPDIGPNYILHWKPENEEEEPVTTRYSLDGKIRRENFESHGELRVWVQNQNGSVKSQEIVIHTQHIVKPPPPTITSSDEDPLEIHWSTICDKLELNVGVCDVRYRTEDDQNWIWTDYNLSSSYGVNEPQPGTVYKFQVRCKCDPSLMSDWSPSFPKKSAESSPVGEVDAWLDCGLLLSNSDCFLNWKNLSISQARGYILGYEIAVFYNNRTEQLINVSMGNPSSLFVYDEMKWRLTSSLKNVSSFSISAYNALGATKTSRLPRPISGKQATEPKIYLKLNEKNLTVSWNQSSKVSDNIKQYVVQYKECLPGSGSDWIKVDKKQTTAFFKGTFKKYTSYQVSLFAVSNLNVISQLATATGYSAQGVPSKVTSFKVSDIVGTKVTLTWEPVPCSNQRGEILYYEIGLNMQGDPNHISIPVRHINVSGITYTLEALSPGQEYTVWIRAVTAAGPSEKVNKTFKINHHEDYAFVTPIVVIVLLVIAIALISFILCVFHGAKKECPLLPQCLYEKVPDPSNSQIFKQMKRQINEPLTWMRGPLYEPYPTISILEIVEIKSKVFDPDMMKKENGCPLMDCQDDQQKDPTRESSGFTDSRYGRKEYSKMVDSDEERNDCWSSSEEEQSTSGYEKHFMPSPLEVMVE
ncbi:interleukin 12 receptor, beta 2a, like [Poecilia reticulata]|uniref:Interleukin-12 receptor subunit beta-2-like n=1 Tax=Poecilia reticulata TaxID=8081 RepID=A0A3P9MWK0_POERE|nr:PREDICTED: interleukin-12 receptor subunit beta-2-like [Poecilia reticulata]XP_008415121.1 PREDICTED: interleukin-12 receptor subunit beta-2-like [Poecilia reticulata]